MMNVYNQVRTILTVLACLFIYSLAEAGTAAECVEIWSDGFIQGGSRLAQDDYRGNKRADINGENLAISHMQSGSGVQIIANARITSRCGLLTPTVQITMPDGFTHSNIYVVKHLLTEVSQEVLYEIKFSVSAQALLADKARGVMEVKFNFAFDDRIGHVDRRMILETDNTAPAPLRADEIKVVDLNGSKVLALTNYGLFKWVRDDGSVMSSVGGHSRNAGVGIDPWVICNGVWEGPSSCHTLYNGTYEMIVVDAAGNVSAPVSMNLLGGGSTGGKGKRR